MELELSTSPRATWVWAVDEGQAGALRDSLRAAGHEAGAARGGNAEPRTLDLDIGAVLRHDAVPTELTPAVFLAAMVDRVLAATPINMHKAARAVRRNAPNESRQPQ